MTEADATLQALVALGSLHFPALALSAHLPTDEGAGHGYYATLLDDLARAEAGGLDDEQAAALERELPEVEAALEKHRFAGPAVAVFSCRPREFLRIWRLVEPLPGRVAVANLLDLAPIRRQLLQHPPTLAAVADKQQARLFSLILGELTEVARLDGQPIRRHRQGGRSAAALQRREDEHARRHLGEVAGAVVELLERGGYHRLAVAGPPEARAELRCHLPATALRLLAAEGPLPINVTGNELAERLRALGARTLTPRP